jgi:transposase
MLQITPQHKICLAINPVDFRLGIDGLRASCIRELQSDPFAGYFFVFRNKKATAIKMLIYDGNGFWLCYKRFSSGKLKWWPKTPAEACNIRAVELSIMLQQGNPQIAALPEDWRRLP